MNSWNWNEEEAVLETAKQQSEGIPPELGRAGGLHVLGKTREALEELERLVARLPECAEAYRVRATVLMDLGQDVEALGDWEKYHTLTRGDAATRLALAECQQKAGRWSEAAEEYRAALREDPEQDEALLGLGLCQLRERRAEEALEMLTLHLERHPQRAQARFGKAVAYQLAGETDEACRLYEELLAEGVEEAGCLTNLALIHREKKDTARMEECAERLLKVAPASQVAQECLAQAAYLRGDYEKALEASEKLASEADADAGRWMNVGLCRKKLGRALEAHEAYTRALELEPWSSEARLRCAEALAEAGRDEEALELSRAGIEVSPQVEDFYDLAMRIHARAGRTEEVEALLEVMALNGARTAESWFRLGNMRLDRKAHEAAQSALLSALDSRSEWPEARLNLALSYYESGQTEAAERQLTVVLAQRPEWQPALRAAAMTSLKLGRLEDALERHEKLLASGLNEPELTYNTALLNDQMGRPERAEELFRKTLGEKPGFTEALVGLGHALENAGREEEARQCWAMAMEQRPELAQDYFRSKR